MIKTLRITGFVLVILAVAFFAFSAFFGAQGDERTEQFLNSAGSVERFSKARGEKSVKIEEQTSPLVNQAQSFALYLNPPAKPAPMPSLSPSASPRITRRPKTVSAKFSLIGTSFHSVNPELSLALIDEPGKGFRWVRQSSQIGHLIIEQIKDGLVVVRDGQRTFELRPERKPKRSLIKSSPGEADSGAVTPVLGRAIAEARVSQEGSEKMVFIEEILVIEELLEELRSAKSGAKGALTADRDEDIAMMEEYISELRATHVSPEEAQRLEVLGQKLKELKGDGEPNQIRDRKGKYRRPRRSPLKR